MYKTLKHSFPLLISCNLLNGYMNYTFTQVITTPWLFLNRCICYHIKTEKSQQFCLTSETSPAFSDEISITPNLLCLTCFGFSGCSVFLIYLFIPTVYSHSLASWATATELIIAKFCNRTAIMFFELCITPDSQTVEFFNKLSFNSCIGFLDCLETKYTHATLTCTCT